MSLEIQTNLVHAVDFHHELVDSVVSGLDFSIRLLSCLFSLLDRNTKLLKLSLHQVSSSLRSALLLDHRRSLFSSDFKFLAKSLVLALEFALNSDRLFGLVVCVGELHFHIGDVSFELSLCANSFLAHGHFAVLK